MAAMNPTPQELQWANELRAAALAQDDDEEDQLQHNSNEPSRTASSRTMKTKQTSSSYVRAMSDLEWLQHAIVAKGNVNKALLRIKNLHDLKVQYGIQGDGSIEQGMRDMEACHRFFPNFVLALGEVPSPSFPAETPAPQKAHVVSIDFTQYDAPKLVSEEAFAVVIRAFFYLSQASQADLASVRGGLHVLGNHEGLSFRNFSLQGERRGRQFYHSCYPIRICAMVMLQAHPLIRLIYATVKLFLSRKVASVFVCPPKRDEYLSEYSDLYPPTVLPNVWKGGKQSIDDMNTIVVEQLRQRYHNAQTFSCLYHTDDAVDTTTDTSS